MRSFFVNFFGLTGSWYFIDLAAESILANVIAPILFTGFLISSLLWLIVKFGINQKGHGGSVYGGSPGGFDGGGGDGGGGDGGC